MTFLTHTTLNFTFTSEVFHIIRKYAYYLLMADADHGPKDLHKWSLRPDNVWEVTFVLFLIQLFLSHCFAKSHVVTETFEKFPHCYGKINLIHRNLRCSLTSPWWWSSRHLSALYSALASDDTCSRHWLTFQLLVSSDFGSASLVLQLRQDLRLHCLSG